MGGWPKRALDLAVAVPATVVLSPVMLGLGVAVRLALGKPVLFRQQRPGFNAEPFTIFKFRSMTDACDAGGRLLPDAERLTGFGRLLRRTSLDELPELLNVLRGDMSVVGPRPLLMQYVGRYSPRQSLRHAAKPGITGWAQVRGRNELDWAAKLELDAWYVEHQSLALDLKIIALTIWTVLSGRGISAPGTATAEEFMGSTNR